MEGVGVGEVGGEGGGRDGRGGKQQEGEWQAHYLSVMSCIMRALLSELPGGPCCQDTFCL